MTFTNLWTIWINLAIYVWFWRPPGIKASEPKNQSNPTKHFQPTTFQIVVIPAHQQDVDRFSTTSACIVCFWWTAPQIVKFTCMLRISNSTLPGRVEPLKFRLPGRCDSQWSPAWFAEGSRFYSGWQRPIWLFTALSTTNYFEMSCFPTL